MQKHISRTNFCYETTCRVAALAGPSRIEQLNSQQSLELCNRESVKLQPCFQLQSNLACLIVIRSSLSSFADPQLSSYTYAYYTLFFDLPGLPLRTLPVHRPTVLQSPRKTGPAKSDHVGKKAGKASLQIQKPVLKATREQKTPRTVEENSPRLEFIAVRSCRITDLQQSTLNILARLVSLRWVQPIIPSQGIIASVCS